MWAASAWQGDRHVLHTAHGRSLVGAGCGHHDLRTRALQKAPAGESGCQGPEKDRHRALPSGVGRKSCNGAAAPWGPGFLGPCRLPGVPLSWGLGQTCSFYRRAGWHGWKGDRRGTPIGPIGPVGWDDPVTATRFISEITGRGPGRRRGSELLQRWVSALLQASVH